jgi:hypothetical protein
MKKTGMGQRFALCVVLCALGAVSYAQDRSKLSVYVPLPEGGTAQQKEYFQTNFKMELIGANYPSVETKAESAYTLFLTIADNPDFVPTAATDGVTSWDDNQLKPFELIIRLVRTESDEEIVSFSFLFDKIESMNEWNLYLLYQALANAYVGDDTPAPLLPVIEDERWRNQLFYLNLGAGADLGFFVRRDDQRIQTSMIVPLALAGMEWHFHDFLSTELDFKLRLMEDGENTAITLTGALTFKLVFKFGAVMLEPYAGVEGAYSLGPPVPLLSGIAGIQLGLRAAPQSAWVVDAGFTRNFMGEFRARNNSLNDVIRMHLMFGFKFGFRDRKPAGAEEETPAEK